MIPAELIDAMIQPGKEELFNKGLEIGQLYTDHGFPIDMALERLDYTKKQKIMVLSGAQQWLIEHRRNSNATDKALDRQRTVNLKTMKSFIATGESGIY